MKKNYFTEKLNKGLIAFTLVFCALFTNSSFAQRNIAWTGATNNNWSTASNWNYPAITSSATFVTTSKTITLLSENTAIAAGDKVTGFGIPEGTTITLVDPTKKIIEISANPYSSPSVVQNGSVTATGYTNVVFTFAIPKVASAAPGILDIAVIGNGGNPTLTTGQYYLAGLTISNNNASGTASTLTIPSGVEIIVETLTNEGVLVKGGNITNEGILDIKSSFSGGVNNISGAYGMTFSLPSVVPSVATEYTYSGSGELAIDTSAGNNFSGGFLFNGVNANANLATYKLEFDGITTFTLSGTKATNGTASTHLMRAIGVGALNACKVIIDGTIDFGTDSTGVTNGLLAVNGGGVDFTIAKDATINVFSNIENPTPTISLYAFGATAIPTFIRNKGVLNIKGIMQRSPLSFSAQNMAIVNFVNDGIVDIDAKSVQAANAGLAITNNQGATQQAVVNLINNATMTIKNLLNGLSWGAPIAMTTNSGAPNLLINNSGTLNLIGSNYSFGSKPFDPNATTATTITGASRITNSGTINTNQELRTFYTINTSTGTINFLSTPDISPLKLMTFTILTTAAATKDATYTDSNGKVYTVVATKASGTGTALVTHVDSTIVNPPTTNTVDPTLVALTKTGGEGDVSIPFTAHTSNNDNAFFASCLNSGVINTNKGIKLMTGISGGTITDATSVLSPGGAEKGIINFNDAPTAAPDAISLKGTIKMQISGNTTAGVDYDKIVFLGTSDVINISEAILDVTGIYTPTSDVTVDILTTYVDPIDPLSLNSGAILNGGPFASVVGLTSGWKVNYVDIIGGKVQLQYSTLSTSDNAFSKFKFNYYPNPTSNSVNLSAEKNISKVELYTITGQKVQSNTVNASQKQLNISNLQRGVYLMEVSIDNAKKTFKIVKQ